MSQLPGMKIAIGWRVTIPPEIRKKLKLEIGDLVAFDEKGRLVKVKIVPVKE